MTMQRSEIQQTRMRMSYPSKQFTEIEFSYELWRVFLGNHSDIIDNLTENKLKLNSKYTLSSEHYQDPFIQGFLRKASTALKNFIRIGRFATGIKQSRIDVDPLPLIPFRKAIQDFYKNTVAAIDLRSKQDMNIDNLELAFNEISLRIQTVFDLYRPLIRAYDSDKRESLLFDTKDAKSIIAFREEIEETWREFFFKLTVCPDSTTFQLPIWRWIFDAFLGILPNYIDKIMDFAKIEIDAEKDKVVLIKDSTREIAYFRPLWSDRLIKLVNQSFKDQTRLFSRQKNPTVSAKPWSVFFAQCLEKLQHENPGLKELIGITHLPIITLLENSCQLYVNQFSKIILSELQYKNRLVMRVKELKAICSMHPFVDQINHVSCDQYVNEGINDLMGSYKEALKFKILPENTWKYWSITVNKSDMRNPYAFRLHYKIGWPVSLIISPEFLANLDCCTNMMARLFYYYTNFRALVVTSMFSTEDGYTVKFTRKVQNFVLAIRQLLYRIFNCLVAKIGTDIDALLEIVQKVQDFSDLEAGVKRWHEKMRMFAIKSHFSNSLDNLFNCADGFIETCKSVSNYQSVENLNHLLETMSHENRRDFVLACESLAPPIQTAQTTELSAFEREISLIVSHITADKFWQNT